MVSFLVVCMKHIVKNLFPMGFKPNEGAHRIQRSILHKNRPVGRSRRRFDFVETSPENLGNFCFSLKVWPFSETAARVCAFDVPVCAYTKMLWWLNSFETAFEDPDYAQERVSTL